MASLFIFHRLQVYQLYKFAVHNLMIPQPAKRCADNADSRIADEVIGDEFTIAQKILSVFIVDIVHIALQNR